MTNQDIESIKFGLQVMPSISKEADVIIKGALEAMESLQSQLDQANAEIEQLKDELSIERDALSLLGELSKKESEQLIELKATITKAKADGIREISDWIEKNYPEDDEPHVISIHYLLSKLSEMEGNVA